jgi:MFS family permease
MSRATDAVRETGTSLSTVFRNPNLRRLNLAFAGSAIGDWAYATAIIVWAYEIGGVTAVGIWGTVRLILMTLVTPFASTIVDRLPRKLIMVSTDLIRGLICLAVAGLIWADAPPMAIFVLATLTSIFAAPFRPAVAALMPSLVNEPEELTAANGTASTIESLAFFVGPAIGGTLVAAFGVPVVVLLNAATFVWSALIVSRIRVGNAADGTEAVAGEPAEAAQGGDTVDATDSTADSTDDTESFWTESMAGFRTIWAHRDLRMVSGVYCLQTMVAGASLVFGVEMAVQMTSFGAPGIGYLDSVMGVGALLGGLVAIGRASAGRLASDFGVGVIFWALPLLLAAIWPQMWAAFLALFIIGIANPIVDVNATTIIQRSADDAVMGRVFGALETALIASMALGSIAMPLLNHTIGLRWSLAIFAVVITLAVIPTFGRLRRLDVELAEPATLTLLRQIPLFAPLEPKSLELVAQQLIPVRVPAGETVITEGEEGKRFYVIESGALTATFGGELLSHMGPGDPFGEIALLRDVPRTATVTADEDSQLFALEREAFLEAVTGDNEVNSRADDLIARRIPTY